MRVLLLHHDPSTPGAADAALGLARALAARGETRDMVVGGVREGARSELLWDGTAVSEGLLTTYRVRCRPDGSLGYLGAAIPVARRLLRRERYDVVHATPGLPAGAMLPFLDLRRAALVVSLTGPDVPGFAPADAASGATRRVLASPARWLWRRADRVIAVSHTLGRLARRTLPELRYAVVPIGVDLARFRPRLRPGRARGRVRCLAVAPPCPVGGLEVLIRAIAAQAADTVELELAGDGPWVRALGPLVAELGVERLVTFAGALDGAALAKHYREADLFALPGTEPAAGAHFAEAMASALPIVASTAAAPELLHEGRNGMLVPADDAQAFAAAIRRLVESPRLRAELGRRNRADAEEHLSWARVSARHLTIYNGVQRRAPARRLLAEQPTSTW